MFRRIAAILVLVMAGVKADAATQKTSASITMTDVYQGVAQPVVPHNTSVGTVICRNPQVKFNEREWISFCDGLMREHMLVDVLIHKKLLHKPRSYVDALFSGHRQDFDGISRYSVFANNARCGNAPQLYIEAVYDKHDKLSKYRSRYYQDGGTESSIDTDWIH